MNNVAISIGFNCHSAVWGKNTGIRKSKAEGYKTCPFDEMLTNYKGVIECISDNFKYLCDPTFLELYKVPKESKFLNSFGDGDIVIRNTKYNFIFNHESPGHANLYINEQWEGGINHFIDNNYLKLKERYSRRVSNFINYLTIPNINVDFIFTHHGNTINFEFKSMMDKKYPTVNYNMIYLDFDKNEQKEFFHLMGVEQ